MSTVTRVVLNSLILVAREIDEPEKVNFKSQILVHEYWTILDHFGVPVLFASGCHQHVLKDVNITFPDNTGTHKMFQYLPILGRSSIWDLKFTFSDEPSPYLFPLSKGSRCKSLSPGEITDARGHHGSRIFKCN